MGRITRAGTYSAHHRILYRCVPPRAAKAHTFTLAPKGYRRGFRYPTAEIARALWMMGRGTSYWAAGADARERTGRRASKDTYLAVYWLERFGEQIFEQLRPRPRKLHSVIIDAVPFNVATVDYKGMPVEGGRMRFVVFGAATQERVHGPYQVLLLRAYPRKDAYSWRSFLREIDGEADRIVCDGEQALLQSAKARWPRAELALSVVQVRLRAEAILTKHELQSRKGALWKALRPSMQTAASWRRFVRLAREQRLPDLERWIIDTEAILGPQIARHERFTSTGVIESVLRRVKKDITLQRGSYKRLERLDLLLNLYTLALNGLDKEAMYERIIAAAR